MKKLLYSLTFLTLFSSPLMATVLRVNNQLATNATQKIFNTLQEAHNFAAGGDTLMVEGTPTQYANVVLTKKLVIIGTGYFINENFDNSGGQHSSRVNNITLNAGSGGSVLLGLSFVVNGNPIINTDNIIISRCLLTSAISFNFSETSNLVITQNYFLAGAVTGVGSSTRISNVVFSNNVVNGIFNPGSDINKSFSAVNNNVFRGTGINTINVRTDNFRNNIIATNATSITVISNNISNNLTLANQLTGNNNQLYDPNLLFVGAGNSTDGQYAIKVDSPYKTAGFQGVEPGIFGGNSPYVLSGMPPFPIILNLSADSFGTQQNGLNVSIKAKTNN